LAPKGFILRRIEVNPGGMSILRAFQIIEPSYAKLEPFFCSMIEMWRQDRPFVFSSMFYVGYGEMMFERNRLDEAERLIRQGLAIAEEGRSAKLYAPAAAALAGIYRSQGKFAETRRWLDEAQSRLEEWGHRYWSRLLEAERVRLFAAESEKLPASAVRRVEEWIRDTELMLSDGFPIHYYYCAIAAVRGLMAFGKIEEALRRIRPLIEMAEKGRRFGERQELLMLQALCLMRQNRLNAAAVSIESALESAERNRSVRPFMDERDMPELLDLYIRFRRSKPVSPPRVTFGFVKELLSLGTSNPARLPRAGSAASPGIGLTVKELEVLELLAQGLPNPQIAERLGITTGTLRNHVSRICRKLSAGNRREAVQRAKELLK